MKFSAPAGDSDPLHRLLCRRRANRNSARRVRERRTQHCDALEAQVIACLVTYYGELFCLASLVSCLTPNHLHTSWPLLAALMSLLLHLCCGSVNTADRGGCLPFFVRCACDAARIGISCLFSTIFTSFDNQIGRKSLCYATPCRSTATSYLCSCASWLTVMVSKWDCKAKKLDSKAPTFCSTMLCCAN